MLLLLEVADKLRAPEDLYVMALAVIAIGLVPKLLSRAALALAVAFDALWAWALWASATTGPLRDEILAELGPAYERRTIAAGLAPVAFDALLLALLVLRSRRRAARRVLAAPAA